MPDDIPLIPTITQDADTGQVLMLAYSNRESLYRTLQTGQAHYWSRSRNCLWKKGETSGNGQVFVSASLDCDSDALLFRVRPAGPACHTGAASCFFVPVASADAAFGELSSAAAKGQGEGGSRPGENESAGREADPESAGDTFAELFDLIEARRRERPQGSYTTRLMEGGVDRIGRKIAEEAGEVIIAAKNQSREQLLWESADLLYHLMVLLASQDVGWDELAEELRKRRKP